MFLYQNHPAIGDPSLKDKKSLGEKKRALRKKPGVIDSHSKLGIHRYSTIGNIL
jgi:hypothetical protein